MRTFVAVAVVPTGLGCAPRGGRPAVEAALRVGSSVNQQCPMMPDAGVDGVTEAEFRGERIGFCCSDCLGEWERMQDSERAARLSRVRQ